MEEEHSRLERLDIAAKAMVGELAFFSHGLIFTFLAAIFVLLALKSAASALETVTVRVLAGITVLVVFLFSVRSRYAFHALALVWAACGIVTFCFYAPHPHTTLGWIARFAFLVAFLEMGYRHLKLGIPLATARGKGWETEWSQVHDWYELPMQVERPSLVLDVPSGSFWTGYFTYRLIHLDDCWAVAKFKTGNFHRLLDFRVLDKSAVRATQVAEGKVDLYLGHQRVKGASPSPEVIGSLMRLAAPATNAQ